MTQEEQVAGGNEDEEMKTRAVWEDVFSYPCSPQKFHWSMICVTRSYRKDPKSPPLWAESKPYQTTMLAVEKKS